jgi:hypothetical protein
MTSINSVSKNNIKNSSNNKKDTMLQSLVNISTVLFIVIIVYLIYKFVIVSDYQRLRVDGFANNQVTIPNITKPNITNKNAINTNTIYEKSIKSIYGNNTRLICSMLPNIFNNSNVCRVNNEIFVPYNFPVHMIKLLDGSIIAVFNDGRLYKKDNMKSTLWVGPITNSMPQDIIPMRMITLSTDLVTLLGVGFDNILYVKTPDKFGSINLTIPWKQVPNNSSIIFVLFDNQTNYLLSIDVNGKLFTKSSSDITTNNNELVTLLDRPILRLYYDLNGYMLAIDNKFDMYQFTELNWKTTPLNLTRGANNNKLQDLLYDNDGKMYGLVFNSNSFMVQIMKQTSVFYLGNFVNLDDVLNSDSNVDTSTQFIMSDLDIVKCKIGSIYDYMSIVNDNDTTDDDPNFAYQKQVIENKSKLVNFCANRNNISGNNYDNYDLLASVDKNNDKITNLKKIINDLLIYEPDNMIIKQNNPIIQ